MSDNIQLYDAHLNLWTLRTTEGAGIHAPHHVSRLLDASELAYRAGRPIPVAIHSTTGVEISIVAGSIEVNTDHNNDSVAVFGSLSVEDPANFRSLVVDPQGLLQTTVVDGPGFEQVGTAPSSPQIGTVVLGIQVGSQPASQVSGNGLMAPLILDDQGRVFVAFGASVAVLPFTQKGDLLTYDGSDEVVLAPTVDNGLLVLDSSTSTGLRWLSPGPSSPSPSRFLREDLTWALPAAGAPSGAASGDLSGTYPGPTVVAVQGVSIGSTTPSTGQALLYSGSQWSPSTLPSIVTDHGLLSGLADDDHVQYLTSPRALTWLGTRTTDDLVQGTTNYYITSPEVVKLAGIEIGATADMSAAEILTAVKTVDGAGSGLDADKLDGQQLSYITGLISTNNDNIVTNADDILTNSNAIALNTAKRSYPSPDEAKLAGIEAFADVTDTTSVAAAGALMSGASAFGDLAGAYPSPTVVAIQGTAISSTAPTTGQAMLYSGTQWSPGTIPSGVTDHGALTGLSDDDHSLYHTDGRALTWLGTRTADDLPVGTTNLYLSSAEQTKLSGIETAADVTDATNVAAAGAHMSGGTDVPVTDGGTGASTAADARTNLGLAIGIDVPAYVLDFGTTFPGTPSAGQRFYRTDLYEWFSYDSSRTKWLGDHVLQYQGTYLGTLANGYDYLDANQIPYSATLGAVAPVDLCIIGGVFSIAASSTATIQLRDDGTSVATIAVTAGTRGVSWALNSSTIATSSVISLYVSGTATGGHAATFYAKRVAT